MLRTLEIRDMLIIDRLDLRFQPGLNVLTGETGAGKSILLDSLGFVLGWRGRAELVRNGADQGEVIAEFDLTAGHPARAILREAGLPDEEALILRRVNSADGRKTAWVNDRRVSGEVLRQLSDVLVELHGQQDDRGLLDPKGHRDLLDAYGDLAALREAVRVAWRDMAARRKARDAAEAAQAALRAEEEFLRHAVTELDALGPQPGEEAELDARRRMMQGAERIRADIAKAAEAIGLNGAEGAAGDALRWLESVADKAEGQLDEPVAAIGRALVELDEAGRGVQRCLEALNFNPLELEETEERLFAIRALVRKHGIIPDDLAAFAEDLRGQLAALDRGDADMRMLAAALADAERRYAHAAEVLTEARVTAALALDRAVMAELAPLKMERAVFTTDIRHAEPGATGQDEVTFRVATNPGAPSGALGKIASGGELSRFLLALKVCLTGTDSGVTMIFDEIDRGVGGATADAVGRRLAQLAAGGQVLVVTHSPQVAARGAHHWRVEKRVEAEETLSTVRAMTGADRVDEIARMLSGERITPEARAAAEALMEG
ncbi:MAG: DNA recombination protein RecN [Roseovarius sp. BRH_c41]|uniref:DNA repair protein RecN n=1 Tax=Roseovarius sp. BRH_c41 TaxID=1629709 RepID=UPI0005F16FFD|nr:DNA repair protein RecN [Roseovarius sp. BRH_c41]KJS42707.1 MAG: DNA recombination protein RecN [Roseovarius sp. BRH_c41]